MEIIAKTDDGFLIKGTANEIGEILRAVQGEKPNEIKIGQKIPAIDYAATITKLKTIPDDYAYKQLIDYAEKFQSHILKLSDAVNQATEI